MPKEPATLPQPGVAVAVNDTVRAAGTLLLLSSFTAQVPCGALGAADSSASWLVRLVTANLAVPPPASAGVNCTSSVPRATDTGSARASALQASTPAITT